MNYPHLVRKNSDPVSAPPEIGIHWINVNSKKEWFSVGTSSVDDWVEKNKAPYQVEYITLSGPDVLAKEISLLDTPETPQFVLLTIDGGPTCFYNLDFIVSGNKLQWTGKRLDGFVGIGDLFQIVYFS